MTFRTDPSLNRTVTSPPALSDHASFVTTRYQLRQHLSIDNQCAKCLSLPEYRCYEKSPNRQFTIPSSCLLSDNSDKNGSMV
jgi:hypothetical protein